MPPVSEAQRRWAFANAGKNTKAGRAAKEFAAADQGGKLSVRWMASVLDRAPANPIDAYWIWRQVPTQAALAALPWDASTIFGPLGSGETGVATWGPTSRTISRASSSV